MNFHCNQWTTTLAQSGSEPFAGRVFVDDQHGKRHQQAEAAEDRDRQNLRATLMDFKKRFPEIVLAMAERSRARLVAALRNGALIVRVSHWLSQSYWRQQATALSASIASTSSLPKPKLPRISAVCSPMRGALHRLVSCLATGGVPGICAMAIVPTPGWSNVVDSFCGLRLLYDRGNRHRSAPAHS